MQVDKRSYRVDADHRKAHYSGDNVTSFWIVTLPKLNILKGWSILVEEPPLPGGIKVGPVHAWIGNASMGHFTSEVSQFHMVGMPGTADSVVTVGSYATRKSWSSQDPNQENVDLGGVNLEDISYFSSQGPTRDGQNKPEIAAPGQMVISALSAAAPESELPLWLRIKDLPYVALQGTSMSAPYVTGALALLLEKDPDINWAEAKRRLIKSARNDFFTGPCWNRRWGYGKLNVERLLTIEP